MLPPRLQSLGLWIEQRLTSSEAAQAALSGAAATDFLAAARPRDYIALLAFLPSDDARFEATLASLHAGSPSKTGCATMFGYAPRYLHSTGQLHKGGADNGVFLVIAAGSRRRSCRAREPFSLLTSRRSEFLTS